MIATRNYVNSSEKDIYSVKRETMSPKFRNEISQFGEKSLTSVDSIATQMTSAINLDRSDISGYARWSRAF